MSIPLVIVGTLVLVAVFPVLALVGLLVDLVTRKWRGRVVRLVVFVTGYAVVTVFTQVSGVFVWIRHGFGRTFMTETGQRTVSRVIRWWIGSMLWLLGLLGVKIRFDHITTPVHGRIVIASRHESLADVFVPTTLGIDRGKSIRVVLAAGLRREPSLDLFAHRSCHYFIRREGADLGSEVKALSRLAEASDHDTAFVIFPEGGLVREARRARVLAKIERDRPEMVDRAQAFRHLLPPRVAGTGALLDAAHDADLVIVGHVGLHRLTDPVTIWRNIPLENDIELFSWRYSRDEIPDDPAEREAWLFDRWAEMDAEIDRRHSELAANRI